MPSRLRPAAICRGLGADGVELGDDTGDGLAGDGANRALQDAIELVRARARNYYHGAAGQVQDEPVIQASGSTLSTERALDRHWRDLKVLASHNPSVYKHQILGAYELHGTHPPLSIYF